MALMGFAAGVLAYIFLRMYVGRNTAVLLGGLIMLNYAMIYNSTYILADVPFAAFVFLALIVTVVGGGSGPSLLWSTILGFVLSITPMLRINGIAIAPAAAFFLIFSWGAVPRFKRFAHLLLILILSYLPFILWLIWKSGFPHSDSEGAYLAAVSERRFIDQTTIIIRAFVGYFSESTLALTGLSIKTGVLEIIAPLVMFIGLAKSLYSGERLLAPLAIIQGAGLLLSSAGERYLLFLLPALYLFLFKGTLVINSTFKKFTGKSYKPKTILLSVFVFLLIGNCVHLLVPIYQARTALAPNGPETPRSAPFFRASDWLKKNDANATVLTTHARVIHFLTGTQTINLVRSGVPEHKTWIKDAAEIAQLIKNKRPEYVFWDEKNSDMYRQVALASESLHLRLKEIPQASSPPRFKLYALE